MDSKAIIGAVQGVTAKWAKQRRRNGTLPLTHGDGR